MWPWDFFGQWNMNGADTYNFQVKMLRVNRQFRIFLCPILVIVEVYGIAELPWARVLDYLLWAEPLSQSSVSE